jgi:hypothetical protein
VTERNLDPTGKRALFELPVAAARDQILSGFRNEGRTAMFSGERRRPGTVVIECSSCGERSRASVIDLGVRLVSGSAWLPGRRHSHWMRCPSCQRWQWCRIGWNE